MAEWDEIAAANEEGRRNVETTRRIADHAQDMAAICECGHDRGSHLRGRLICYGDEGECGCSEFVAGASDEGSKNIAALRITQDEMDEAADALETLAGIDEGENMDTERLHELALRLRKGDSDAVPVWLREMLGPKTDEERRQRRIDLIAEVIKLREERNDLSQMVQTVTEAGQHHVIASEGMRQALGSVIDLVDELCMGLAVGQSPDREWAEGVSQTLAAHRKALGFSEPEF